MLFPPPRERTDAPPRYTRVSQGKVEGKPELSRLLHEEGEAGLRTFGYEPERSLRASTGFQCAVERDATCPAPPTSKQPARPAARPSRPNLRGPTGQVSYDIGSGSLRLALGA